MDRWLTVNVVSPLRRTLGQRSSECRIPILMYHAVTDDPEPGVRGYYRLNTPPALFREHLRILRDEGFTVVDLRTAAACLKSGQITRNAQPPTSIHGRSDHPQPPALNTQSPDSTSPPMAGGLAAGRDRSGQDLSCSRGDEENAGNPQATGFLPGGASGVARSDGGHSIPQPSNSVPLRNDPFVRMAVITFDDGFRDFLTSAWPALSEFGYNATVFLPTRFIGRQRAAFHGRDCLTWAEVRDLRREGTLFGSHTVSHSPLAEMEQTVFESEIRDSKRTIEDELGESIETFSHPYAFPSADDAYLQRFRHSLSSCGYRLAVTTTLGCAHPGDDPLLLKRLPANGADTAALFRAKLHGAYDWLAAPQGILKRAKRLARRWSAPRKTVVDGPGL